MTTQRIVTGAHYGIGSWLLQRLSAVVIALYTVILIIAVLRLPEFNYGNWATLFAHPFMKVATWLGGAALLYHAWVGVRDIFMDYIKPTGVRLVLQAGTVLLLAGYGFWLAIILWRL
jgi:succinate dehydrogenase / fumarate reductase membrane anchor subunit